MQMPIPPVSQWRNRQTPRAAQENEPGKRASRAPRCNAPIQSTAGQAIGAGAGRVGVVVVMLYLASQRGRGQTLRLVRCGPARGADPGSRLGGGAGRALGGEVPAGPGAHGSVDGEVVLARAEDADNPVNGRGLGFGRAEALWSTGRSEST